jgi:hypothetical protein
LVVIAYFIGAIHRVTIDLGPAWEVHVVGVGQDVDRYVCPLRCWHEISTVVRAADHAVLRGTTFQRGVLARRVADVSVVALVRQVPKISVARIEADPIFLELSP